MSSHYLHGNGLEPLVRMQVEATQLQGRIEFMWTGIVQLQERIVAFYAVHV